MARCGRGAHRHERETAARRDRDLARLVELCAAAVAGAAAVATGERGGHPGGDVDAANALVVLRCRTGGGHTH